MNRHFDADAIVDPFTLLPPEIDFLGTNKPHNHLGKALLLKFFQAEGRFPEGEDDFPFGIIEYVARQLDLPPEAIQEYAWDGRTISDHRSQIRELLGYHRATLADQEALQRWLMQEVGVLIDSGKFPTLSKRLRLFRHRHWHMPCS